MGDSIFDFSDKFGQPSPFEDWIEADRNRRNQRSKEFEKKALNLAPSNSFIRMMFYGGAKSSSHNNTFLNAAQKVNKDYSVKAKIYPISQGGQQIVDKINAQNKDSVQSLDIFSHGGPKNLYFKPDQDGYRQDLYMTDDLEQEHGRWNRIFSSDKNDNGADLSEIKYSVFTDGAKVEFHGCNTASINDPNDVNFARTFSAYLYLAGKGNAVVVGHIQNANPNISGGGANSDYRHGTRRIYHGGFTLFLTRQKGRITASTINKYLNKKAREGTSYNGENEKTWK